jgi:hypothetical protein
MEVRVHRSVGLRNDLLVVLEASEIAEVRLGIANRNRLLELPGLTRHRGATEGEQEENRKCKMPLEEHLERLGLVDGEGRPRRRVIAVGNRNLGNNHGFVAWQRDREPRSFHVRGDPLDWPGYSCLVADRRGRLSIGNLRVAAGSDRVESADDGADLSDEIQWATFGQWVLRGGRVVGIEEITDQFYDIRHVLAFDTSRPEGKKIEAEIFAGYPERFRENALKALLQDGVPRSRYLHNCIGLSDDRIFILQREGTIEEMGHWLKEAGAEDGIILDNGGSVACWAWCVYPNGGFIFAAPDYRPPATSIIAFVLKGPVRTNLPGGSVSYTVL